MSPFILTPLRQTLNRRAAPSYETISTLAHREKHGLCTLLTRIRERIRELQIHMSRMLTNHTMHERGEATFREFMAPQLSPTELEELRLHRLQELRAVIESLRREIRSAPPGTSADPVLKHLVRHS